MSILLLGCKKDKTIPIGVTAVVNNANWTATIYGASIFKGYLDTIPTLSIFVDYDAGYTPTIQNEIDLTIHGFKYATCTYNIPDTYYNSEIEYQYINDYYSTTGTITITQISAHNIQGTFSCMLTGPLTVTNGQFNVPIQ